MHQSENISERTYVNLTVYLLGICKQEFTSCGNFNYEFVFVASGEFGNGFGVRLYKGPLSRISIYLFRQTVLVRNSGDCPREKCRIEKTLLHSALLRKFIVNNENDPLTVNNII